MPQFVAAREAMVERQLRRRGIRDPDVLRAFREVPREEFVDQAQADQAYGDHPLPIPAGQTISQPFIVATMIEQAGIGRGDQVLEVGGGSGYAAAVISRIAGQVIAVERHRDLAALARQRMEQLGYRNVTIVEADGTRGWPDEAPYDAILVAAAAPRIPAALVEQLRPGGRLVMPLGHANSVQRLVRLTSGADGEDRRDDLGPVRFVPLVEDGAMG